MVDTGLKEANKGSFVTALKMFQGFKYFQEVILLVGLIILSTVFSFLSPHFFTISNLMVVLQQVSITTIVAFGMAFVIISQGIDLSVGAAIALIGLPVAKIIINGGGSPLFIVLGILSAIILGGLIGLFNGINIVYLRLAPFIATLATMMICRGLVLTLTKARPVFGLPNSYIFIGNGFVGPIPVSVIIMLVIFVIVIYVTNYTIFGRTVYAIGGNEEAARLSGINVKRIRISVYIISGVCVGIGSVIFTARLASCQPAAGDPFLFDAITATILGGVALFGGSGTMVGVLIGAIIMGVINNGQALLNVDPYLQQVIKGIIVIIAVVSSSFKRS